MARVGTGVERQPSVHLVRRPLQQVVAQPAVVLATQLGLGALREDWSRVSQVLRVSRVLQVSQVLVQVLQVRACEMMVASEESASPVIL